jgi:uncharacterized membrane protein YjgN (DUF898 family)
MASFDAGGLATAPGPIDRQTGNVRFLGQDAPYWRILVRGAVLLMVTLGIYRFWLITDTRRFLWANTEIDGESLEYSGTALEILLGFLVAIALLVPLYIVFFLGALGVGTAGPMTGIAVVALAIIGQYAVWRARSYRLTRTVFRGLHFHQTGSGLHYAVCVLFWWAMMALTLGLAYPFAQASLERFKLGHTHYGDLPGRFEGSAVQLLLRGLPLWFVIVAPTLIALSALLAVDWAQIGQIMRAGRSTSDILGRIGAQAPEFYGAIGLFVVALGFAVVAAIVLFPAFQTIVMRWWVSGIRFADISATSQLRMFDVYKAYLRFLGYLFLFALAMLIVAFVTFAMIGIVFGTSDQSKFAEMFTILAMVGLYVVSALGLSTIYQATAKLWVWRLTAQSAVLSDVSLLHRVKGAGEPGSPLGEGLADALNVGGL